LAFHDCGHAAPVGTRRPALFLPAPSPIGHAPPPPAVLISLPPIHRGSVDAADIPGACGFPARDAQRGGRPGSVALSPRRIRLLLVSAPPEPPPGGDGAPEALRPVQGAHRLRQPRAQGPLRPGLPGQPAHPRDHGRRPLLQARRLPQRDGRLRVEAARPPRTTWRSPSPTACSASSSRTPRSPATP